MNASTVIDWLTVLRAAESLEFTRIVYWNRWSLHYCEFAPVSGRLHLDIVIDGYEVRTVADADV